MADIPSDLIGDKQNTEEQVKPKCCSPDWCKANSKQLIIISLILILILFVVIDALSKGCTLYEQPEARKFRLTCEVGKNFSDSDTFICKSSGEGNDAWEALPAGNPTRCGQTSACLVAGIDSFLNWISENVAAGVFVFILAYIIVTVAFIPGSLLTIGAGVAFGGALGLGPGTGLGSVSVWAGATIGCSFAFLLGRFLFRDWVQELTAKFPIAKSIDLAVQKKGLLTVGLLRFSPAIPFNVFNYLMGATAVSFKDYFLASATCMIPGTVGFVFIGAVIGSSVRQGSDGSCEEGDNTVQTVLLVVGIIFTILAVVLISYVAKKQLAEILKEGDGEKKEEDGEVAPKERTMQA